MLGRILSIRTEDDIYYALSIVRNLMHELGFSHLDQQKVLVSVSELTRNVLDHADAKGIFTCEQVDRGIKFCVKDSGPGIRNIEEILEGRKQPGSRGLGLGLSGVRRLVDEFNIETSERGTKIVAIKRAGR